MKTIKASLIGLFLTSFYFTIFLSVAEAGNRVYSTCVLTPENAHEAKLLVTLNDHTMGAWNAVFSPDGQLLASAAEDKMVYVRPLDQLEPATQLAGHLTWVLGLAFSPDGSTLASAGTAGFNGVSPGIIRLWDVATATEIRELDGNAYGTWSLDYQESTGYLVSCGKDQLVKLWNPSTGDLIRTFTGHVGWVLSVDFNPHQDLIASSGTDWTIRIWNSLTGDQLKLLTGHTNNVGYVKFSPDGNYLASSADDRTVRLWEVSSGDPVWMKAAGQDWVNCVTFNPDGQLLLTCGHDGSVCLRAAADGSELVRLTDHEGPVLRGSFNPSGTLFATASWDNTIRVWGIPSGIDSTIQMPSVPDNNDSVQIESYIKDYSGVQSLDLSYDAGDGPHVLTMYDDGSHGDNTAEDNVYSNYIPVAPEGTQIDYFLTLVDSCDESVSDPAGAPGNFYEYVVVSDCCQGIRGNSNGDPDDKVNIADVTYLTEYLFGVPNGPAPICSAEGNANGDAQRKINIADVTFMIAYLFGQPNGPAPPNCPGL